MHRLISLFVLTIALITAPSAVSPQGYAQTDFIIAGCGTGNFAVFDQNLTFKNNLASGLGCATSLDLMTNGTLATAANAGTLTSATVRFFNSSGVIFDSFAGSDLGRPLDIKSFGFSRLFASRAAGGVGIGEFDFDGALLNSFGTQEDYTGVAILPGNIMWAGRFEAGPIDVFDLNTPGPPITSINIAADGQVGATSMYYSPSTDTVLITDNSTGRVWERAPNGTLIRQFLLGRAQFGVTRGPNGDVFATECFGSGQNGVHRWNQTGTYLGFTSIDPTIVGCPQNIVWAGNAVITAAGVTVGGRVLTVDGRGLANATVRLMDTSGNTRSARTSSLGYFQFDEVEAGGTYLIAVQGKGLNYAARVISVNDDMAGVDFIPESQLK